MRKLYSHILLFFVSVCLTLSLSSQTTPPYYNHTTGINNSYPLSSNTSNHVQWLAEPNTFWSGGVGNGTAAIPGNITKIYILIGTAGSSAVYTNFELSLGQNVGTLNAFPTTTYYTGLTSCFFQAAYPINTAVSGQWYEIILQNPFSYDPTLSLIIDLKHDSFSGSGKTVNQFTGLTGNHRIFGSSTSLVGTGSDNRILNFGFEIVPQNAMNDAGVTDIIEPTTGCVGTHDVKAEISNLGINQLTSLSVQWSVNGVFQGTLPYSQLLDTSNGTGQSVDTVTLGTINFINNGIYNIRAWTVNPNNQSDTVNYNDTSYVSITGSNYPTPTLGLDTSFCPDQPLTLVASSSLPDLVTWNDNTTGNSKIITVPGFYRAEIYKNGCLTVDSINVSAHPSAPPVNLGNDTTFCYGDIILLDATASGVTYTWHDNSTNATFSADTAGTFGVVIEDANTCKSSDSIKLTLLKDPTIVAFANPGTNICFGTPVNFQAIGMTHGSEMYQLVINNINVGSAQSSSIFTNPTLNNGDTVRIDLLTDQCATSPYTVPSNSFEMKINPSPKLINGISVDTVLENTKKNYAVAPVAGSSYQWQVTGGSIIGSSTNFAIQVQWAGANPNASVTLTETDNGNCSYDNVLSTVVISVVGIEESNDIPAWEVYPNPANSDVNIFLSIDKTQRINLALYDMTGKKIKSIFDADISADKIFTISVDDINNGLYFLRISTSSGYESVKKLSIKH